MKTNCFSPLLSKGRFLAIASALLSLPTLSHAHTNLFVATDGSAQFKTVQDAVMAVPMGTETNHVLIHIKPGTYKEQIYIQREKRFFHFIGEKAETTILTFDLNANLPGPDGKKLGTFRTPSTQIDSEDFTAENITFENSAGPVGQALAIRVDGDRVIFRNCRFLGWQDTILLNRGRQYFDNCYIEGHVDFIFGGATSYFEKCRINCLRDGFITAASTPSNQTYGFIFDHCTVTGRPDVKTYLGRPWRIYANTVFMNTEMADVVRPEGWHNWNKKEAETTARYAEFNNSGPGAGPKTRAAWIKQLPRREAKKLTPENVLSGTDGWNPSANPLEHRRWFHFLFGR